jgi:high-affinity Fe2+/Pb2+ permease
MKPKWLLIVGLILIAIGATRFLQSLGIGGGSGSVLVILGGFCFLVAAIVLYLVRRQREKSGDVDRESR